ncbi:MAG: hypothetical protein JWM03_1826 [Rhodocyclales bacterium]|nr:hypothetical protein [Rhodocyclales bacterium]
MRHLIALAAILAAVLTANAAFAADTSCEAQAAEKKLAGAAKNSFIKKCSGASASPAQASCDAKATDKKLAGAAKNSFVKKCVADAK